MSHCQSCHRWVVLICVQTLLALAVGCSDTSPPDSRYDVRVADKDTENWMRQFETAENNRDLLEASGKLSLAAAGSERDVILQFYVRMLSSDSLMIQKRAAFGIQAAGLPTHSAAASTLVDLLIHEVLMDDQRASTRDSAGSEQVDHGLVQNLTEALKVVGDSSQLPALRTLAEHSSRDYDNSLSQLMVNETLQELEAREHTLPAADETQQTQGLSRQDQIRADAQKICPVCGNPLASVERPIKLTIGTHIIFADSQDCWAPIMTDPETYLSKLATTEASQALDDESTETPANGPEVTAPQ